MPETTMPDSAEIALLRDAATVVAYCAEMLGRLDRALEYRLPPEPRPVLALVAKEADDAS